MFTIFCPVVGLILGGVLFGLSTAVDITSGHFDLGSFLVGLATLAVGGVAAFKLFGSVELLAKISGTAAKGGRFFTSSSVSAAKGILDSAGAVVGKIGDSAGAVLGKTGGSFVKNAVSNFAFDSATGLAGKGIGDAIDHKQFTGQDAAAIFAGAAAGGVVGGAFGAAKTGLGLDPDTPSPGSSGPPDTASTTGGVAGSDVGHAYPDDASSTYSTTGGVAGSDVGHAYPDDASSTYSTTGGVAGSDVGHAYPDDASSTYSTTGGVAGSDVGHAYPDDASSTYSTTGGVAGSDKALPPLPGETDKALPPSPADKALPPLPWKGVAIDQGGRIGNDVANAGVEIAVGQAIGNTTGHQQDPPGQQANEYAYADLPALAVGDITEPPTGK